MLKKRRPIPFFMARITLDLRTEVEENAQRYFEAAKKARRKAKGAEQAIATWKAKLTQTPDKEPPKKVLEATRKREWFEKFRWCISSDGFLMVGGRDASTNELLVKRHAQPGDVVLHTDMAGSPFIIVKIRGQGGVAESPLEEAAQFCAAYGRGWKNGLSPASKCSMSRRIR